MLSLLQKKKHKNITILKEQWLAFMIHNTVKQILFSFWIIHEISFGAKFNLIHFIYQFENIPYIPVVDILHCNSLNKPIPKEGMLAN